jgi:SAM-dependent methyltransferase
MAAIDPVEARALAAEAWAEVSVPLDLQLSPLGLRAMAALEVAQGETILDVGCGAGQTLLQLAERVGPGGRVIGVDIAPSLVELARRRAADFEHVRLLTDDAETFDLPSGSLDAVFSRFGVMAFANPVAAFSNLRRMLRPKGRLAFVCWRALPENELDYLSLRAAGLQDQADLTPFRFEDPEVIRGTLSAAGFNGIGVEPHDQKVSSGDVDVMLSVLLRVGPLGRILREQPELREAAEPRVRDALAAVADGSGVWLNAATWIVTAHA